MTRTWDLDGSQGAAERPRTWVLVGGLAVAVATLHLITGWHSEGPVVFDDEGGYLRIARHLAGEGPVATTKYFPGYSLLITPIHWALGSTGAIFSGVKVLNAALGGATAVFAYLASGYLLPGDDRWKRLGATALVSLYPSYLLFSNQAFSENALVPLSMLLAYLVARWAPGRPGWSAAIGLGALGAYALVVHPRSIGVAAALVVVIGLWWWPWSANIRRVAAFVAGAVVVGIIGLVIVQWERSGGGPGGSTYRLERIIEKRDGWEGVRTLLAGGAGQVLYLVTVTGGLVVLAAVEFSRAVGRAWRDRDRSASTALVAYAGLTTLLVFVTSAVFISPTPDSGRPDAALYGRYNEGLLAPFLLVGASTLLSGRVRLWDPGRRRRGALPWALGSIAVSVAVVVVWQSDTLLAQPVNNPFNILALFPVVIFLGGVEPVPIALLGMGAVGAFLTLGRRAPGLAVLLGIAAFVALAGRMAFFHLPQAHYDVREAQREVAETVNVVDDRFGVECVGADRFDQPIYHVQLYRWYVDDAHLREFSSDVGEPPCGPLVVTSRTDLDASYPGAQLVAREGGEIESFLWVLPGELQEQLHATGVSP